MLMEIEVVLYQNAKQSVKIYYFMALAFVSGNNFFSLKECLYLKLIKERCLSVFL